MKKENIGKLVDLGAGDHVLHPDDLPDPRPAGQIIHPYAIRKRSSI
jgi:hypothetical protein